MVDYAAGFFLLGGFLLGFVAGSATMHFHAWLKHKAGGKAIK